MASTAAVSLAYQRASGLAADGNLRASESVKFGGANAWRDGRSSNFYPFTNRFAGAPRQKEWLKIRLDLQPLAPGGSAAVLC